VKYKNYISLKSGITTWHAIMAGKIELYAKFKNDEIVANIELNFGNFIVNFKKPLKVVIFMK